VKVKVKIAEVRTVSVVPGGRSMESWQNAQVLRLFTGRVVSPLANPKR
jgi:hypothetical protein